MMWGWHSGWAWLWMGVGMLVCAGLVAGVVLAIVHAVRRRGGDNGCDLEDLDELLLRGDLGDDFRRRSGLIRP